MEVDSDVAVFITIGDERTQIPSFWMFSDDPNFRTRAFEDEIAKLNLDPNIIALWRARIEAGPLSDDEFDELHNDLRLRPQEVAATIRLEFSKPEGNIPLIVPGERKYYTNLIGERQDASNIEEYARDAAPRIKRLVDWDFMRGFAQCLLFCANPTLTKLIDLSGRPAGEVETFFQWLSAEGDRWSQIAGIEVGIRSLSQFPAIEPIISNLLENMRDEDVSKPGARFRLTAELFIFADGEFSRVRTFEGEPPFWRRLATTAQAALIEREIVLIDHEPNPKSWSKLRAEHFYMQTMADLRLEPRWLPDLMNPEQLRIEFLMRARIVAEEVKENLPEGRLRELLLGSDPGSLTHHTPMPFAYIPSPIESASNAPLPMPEDMLAELRAPKDDKPLEARVFASVVNLALVFRLGPEVSPLIASILRKVKYRLTLRPDSSLTFSLLAGLAVVAAVTRSAELADEVRILTRVLRRRREVTDDPDNQMRIALYASASRAELEPWCRAVGDWMLEIANEPMDRQAAAELHSHIRRLCTIEPTLWPYVSKAEAVLASLT